MSTSVTIHLSDDECAHIQSFVHRGRTNARTLTRAHILLKLDAGWSDTAICDAFSVGATTIWRVRQRYAAGGLEAVLHDRRQARRRAALSGEQLAHLVAIACSDAPAGHDHWTLRLLAGKAVELGYVRSISPETIRLALKKTS
jgi:transposase